MIYFVKTEHWNDGKYQPLVEQIFNGEKPQFIEESGPYTGYSLSATPATNDQRWIVGSTREEMLQAGLLPPAPAGVELVEVATETVYTVYIEYSSGRCILHEGTDQTEFEATIAELEAKNAALREKTSRRAPKPVAYQSEISQRPIRPPAPQDRWHELDSETKSRLSR